MHNRDIHNAAINIQQAQHAACFLLYRNYRVISIKQKRTNPHNVD